MKWTIPNILTILRLIAAFVVPLIFLVFERPVADWVAIVLVFLASWTDWFDGYLARAWNEQTKLGTMLDPIADKAMVIIALAVVCIYTPWTSWLILPATIIIFREVFISGLREYLGQSAGTLAVTPIAKWKTSVQMLTIGTLLLQSICLHHEVMWLSNLFGWIGLALLWIAAILTLITGVDYLKKAMPFLREDEA